MTRSIATVYRLTSPPAPNAYLPLMWIEPVVIEGRNVNLVPLDATHAPALFAAADPELFRFTPQAPPEWSIRGFEQEITKVLAYPDVVAFAIILKADNRPIGRTTFMDIRPTHRGLEIGRTWIARAHHGTLINPEIKYLMLRHAFERLAPPAIRVQLTTGDANLHSQRAIAKLGAVREGVIRSHVIVPSGPSPSDPLKPRNTVFYGILDTEWPSIKANLETRLGIRST